MIGGGGFIIQPILFFFIYILSLYDSYLPLSTLFVRFFFNHTIQKQSLRYHYIYCHLSSRKWQQAIKVFFASIHSYDCGVLSFWLTSYILSIVCSNTIFTGFVAIIANKESLYFLLWRNLFLRLNWFYFLIYLKSLYESYLPLAKIFIIFFFNYLIQNQISTATVTIHEVIVWVLIFLPF